jgi:uncharacterized repeat protein (TIGR01451 family)
MMRMFQARASLLQLALLPLILSVTEARAQTPVYSQTLRGRMVVTGNALGLDSSQTTVGQPGTRGGIGTFISNPLEFATLKDNGYPTGTTSDWTKNGSRAVLDLPAGVAIAHAQLLWGCSSQVNGAPAAPLTTPSTVTLTLPNGVKQVISPQSETTSLTLFSSTYKFYMRWANVTGAISTGGAGTYQVSRVVGTAATSGVTGCGWTLFVVYENDELPLKNINLWVSADEVRYNGAGCPCQTEIAVSGFCTPPYPADATGTIFVTSLEGDARYTNDEFALADPLAEGEFYPLSGPNNAWDNFFSSQINTASGGLLDTRGTFGTRNHTVDPDDGQTFTLVSGARVGWDITAVPVNDWDYNPYVLDNSQSQTRIRVTSGGAPGVEGDDFIVGAIGLELEVASPYIDSLHDVDKSFTFAGDTLTSTVYVFNDGNGRADDVRFCFALPSNTTYTGPFYLDGSVIPSVTSAQLNPSGCQDGSGGVSIGAIEAGDYKEVILSYRVDAIQPPPSAQSEVTVTPNFFSRWRPDCNAAPQQGDAQVGEAATVPGASIDANLTVTPVTPPAVSAGAILTYTLTLSNPSTTSISGARLKLATPVGTSFVAGSARVNGVSQAGAASPWESSANLPTLPANGTVSVSFNVTVTATQATTITQTGYVDIDGAGAAAERPSNTVLTLVAGEVITPTDTDRDTIPDPDDNCILVPNTDQNNNYDATGYNPNANDEGDACDDTDGDGLFDRDEDPTGNGRQPNETDATKADTDRDGLCDGSKVVSPCAGFEDSDGDKNPADWATSEPSPIDPDTDGDGICDGRNAGGECLGGELDNGTFPLKTDSDQDGLCDGPAGGLFDSSGCKGDETGGNGNYDASTDTDPSRSDSDQDGLCDGFDNGAQDCEGSEDKDGDRDPSDFDQKTDSETNPLDADTDDGGVKDGVEVLTQQTNPRDRCEGDLVNCDVADDDGDGIPNDADLCTDRDGDGYGVGPNCLGPDCNDFVPQCTTDCVTDINGSDGNGIPDCEEQCDDKDLDGFGVGPSCLGPDCNDDVASCTNDCSDFEGDGLPNCVDPDDDDDGLGDGAETMRGSDPRNPDTDGDGLRDGPEVDTYGTDPKNPDTDGDGLTDGAEILNHGTSPTNPDSDGEGLKDGDEVNVHRTNPNNPDTDFGGMDDYNEVVRGQNPVDNPADDVGGGKYRGSSATGCGASRDGSWLVLVVLFAAVLVFRRRRLSVATLAVASIAGGVRAQNVDGMGLNHFTVKPGVDRIFSVEGTEVAPAWSPYGGVWFHYLGKPLTFVTNRGGIETESVVVDQMMQLDAAVGLGIADLLELEFIAPVVLSSEGDEARFPGLGKTGVGDMLARLRFQILGRDDRGEGVGLNLGVGVGIPSGAADAGTGDGGVTILPKLALSVAYGPVLIAGNAGVKVRTTEGDFSNLSIGTELAFGAGVQVQLADPIAIGMELFGSTPISNPFGDKAETPVELVTGLRVRALGGLHFDIGGGTGIQSGYGAPELRIFGGVQWAEYGPGEPDTDGDGFVDSMDACPLEPEDKDGFEDGDGCPDDDNDKDGVKDLRDPCRDVPEDIDDFEDSDGCPEEDNDRDGLKDLEDDCPDAPEDKDGFRDDDGCPDPDNDADGVNDVDDKCVDVPETKNEYQDDDGCPDEPPLARIENCRIIIAEKVYFDTNKATIKPVSFPLLNEVARIIKENSGISRVDIEGHTDSDGAAAYNKTLSDQRAKSVRKYLIGQGIPAAKLTGKGYGKERPIADNKTPEGKEKNRRVEFIVKDAECGKK